MIQRPHRRPAHSAVRTPSIIICTACETQHHATDASPPDDWLIHNFTALCPDCVGASERPLARLALFAASILRDTDTVALRDLGLALDEAADRGCIHPWRDNSELVRIMQRLNWQKVGYAGEGQGRSPLYRRVATTARGA